MSDGVCACVPGSAPACPATALGWFGGWGARWAASALGARASRAVAAAARARRRDVCVMTTPRSLRSVDVTTLRRAGSAAVARRFAAGSWPCGAQSARRRVAVRAMDIRVLGPVEASVAERPVVLRAAKQRAVLAMLALDANHTVSMDRLIEGLWGEHPPASASKLVQQHISQLRKMLADDGAPIVTRGRGYELMISPDDVDALRFTRLVAQGAGREALTLWRGQALGDVADEPFAAEEIRRLDELRLGALEQAVDADLAAGRHREVAAEFAALVTEHPLRERLHAQRMLALYRCGRQADALEVYRQARAVLVEQIGVEPGPELRELHAAVLRQDRSLDAPVQAVLPPELERGPPLAGRTAELERLRAAWRRVRRGRGCTLVLSGIEGIGRTRLAAELAAEAREDGALVLYGEGDVARAGAASRPTLLVLDIDVAGPAVVELASEIATRPALLVVISREVPAAGELPGAGVIELGPLDAAGVGAIAALYAPEGV